MKKLLLLGVILVVAGLGLILVSDPVLTSSSSTPKSTSILENSGNSTSISPPSGADCTTLSSGGVQCGTNAPSSGSSGTVAVVVTGIGIAFCGAGLFLTAIESLSKQITSFQPKAVT